MKKMADYKPCGFNILVAVEEYVNTIKKGDKYSELAGFQLSTLEQAKREQEGHFRGRVVALGPTVHIGYGGIHGETPEERAAEWGYKIGDLIHYVRYEGQQIIDEETGVIYRLIHDCAILGVCHD